MSGEQPKNFGKYAVLCSLGQGGMARVYLTVSSGAAGVNKLLVVKELRSDLAAETSSRGMFLDEARLSTRLNHPNVVQTLDVAEEGESMYLTMEFLDGQTLHAILAARARGTAIDVSLLLQITADTLAALHYAHELRDYDGTSLHVVHRDVSPHNVFVTYDGVVKLMDFGIAKAGDATTSTAAGLLKGKVRYCAPEQAAGRECDRRVDVFAVGILIWEMVAGRRMWRDMPDTAILLNLVQGLIPTLRSVKPDVDPQLEAICAKALAVDPNDRYATAEDMRNELLAYIDGTSARGATPNLARWIQHAFGRERAAMREKIDTQMRWRKDELSVSGSRPAMELTGTSTSPTLTTTGTTSELVAERSTTKVTGPAGRLRLGLIAAGALGAVAVVTLLAVGQRGATPPAAASPPPVVAPPPVHAPAPSAVEALKDVRVKIRVSPATTELFLDGVPLGGGPFEGVRPRDDRTRQLVARAKGYKDRTVPVVFERDLDLMVELAPAPPEARSAPPRVERPAAAPRPAPSAAPAHTGRGPRRTIEEDDPYHH